MQARELIPDLFPLPFFGFGMTGLRQHWLTVDTPSNLECQGLLTMTWTQPDFKEVTARDEVNRGADSAEALTNKPSHQIRVEIHLH